MDPFLQDADPTVEKNADPDPRYNMYDNFCQLFEIILFDSFMPIKVYIIVEKMKKRILCLYLVFTGSGSVSIFKKGGFGS